MLSVNSQGILSGSSDKLGSCSVAATGARVKNKPALLSFSENVVRDEKVRKWH